MKFVFKYRASIALEPRAKDNEGKKIDFIHSIGYFKKGIYPIEGKIFNLTVKIRINNKAVQKDGVEIKTWFNNSTDLIKELFEKWPKIIPKEKPIIIVNIIVNKLMVKVVVAESKIISETLLLNRYDIPKSPCKTFFIHEKYLWYRGLSKLNSFSSCWIFTSSASGPKMAIAGLPGIMLKVKKVKRVTKNKVVI